MSTIFIVTTMAYNDPETLDIHIFDVCQQAEDFAEKCEEYAESHPELMLMVERQGEHDSNILAEEAFENFKSTFE